MPRDGSYDPDRRADDWIAATAVPHSAEAEQGLLGALLIDNRAYERVSEFLKPEHFYAPVHGRIYEAISKLLSRGKIASSVTLKAVFQGDEDLSERGGAAYLGDLTTATATIMSVADYGRLIVDMHERRQLIAIADDMARMARAGDVDESAPQIRERAEQQLFTLGGEGVADTGPRPFSGVLTDVITTAQAAYRKEPGARGISTGLMDLDRKITGLRAKNFVVLAGRPSMGKTALATNIAFNAAKDYRITNGKSGCPVAFFSLEMSAEELGHRIVCQQSGIDSDKVEKGDVTPEEFQLFVQSTQALASIPLHIDDTPALTISQIRTRARRLKRQGGLGLIVVDYLQLVRGSNSKQAQGSRVLEIGEITAGLKSIAKELGVPVLALSQVSRNLEQRDDKRPQLSDLRESGTIEQDADIVMFVFREEYYLTRDEPKQGNETNEKFAEKQADWMARCTQMRNIAEIIIGKQRKGPTGTIKVRFDGPTTTFSDLASMPGYGMNL